MDPLEALDWRLERADQHLATLDKERRRFLARIDKKKRRIIGKFERDTSEYVFRVNSKPLDPRLGLIVGEFAHHLRATLDNLLWQLVLLRGGSPTRETQYPIYESRERYASSLWMLRGISADDRALIESTQPFNHGAKPADAYMALLAWLNNVDKHRIAHPVSIRARISDMTVSYGDEGPFAGYFPWHPDFVRDVRKILDVTYAPSIATDDRTELMRVLIEPSGLNPEMKMKGDEPIDVAFSDHVPLTIRDLWEMRAVVAEIVERFRPRFDI